MYLIHAHLLGPGEIPLPAGIRDRIRARPTGSASIEHVTPHLEHPGAPVLGLFVAAETLEEAEQAAETACLDALGSESSLAGYALVRCSAAFVRAFYEAGLR
ncbi:hypothetical protein [Streptomyces sp. NPDC026673]|uniref:hypothetical protein n=1 Tax=Streptomyces sp. NPDC026673 TaxID=3155724 RepID=UPI0034013164